MIGSRLTAKKYIKSRVFICAPNSKVRRSRTSFMMLRKKINANITNAMKLSDERAYRSIRSLDDSMANVFQRFDDCSATSSVSDATIKVPITQGVFRRFIFATAFSTIASLT